MAAYTYILRCQDGSLYTGITTDIRHRFSVHLSRARASARYTKSHPVKTIVALWEAPDYSAAAKLEYRLKRLKKQEKEALILSPTVLFSTYLPMLSEQEYGFVLQQFIDINDQKEKKENDTGDLL